MNVTLMCDASYCPESRVAGYGFWVVSARGKHSGGGSIMTMQVHSSTTAEMMAVANSLHCALMEGVVIERDSVLVQIDCIAAIQAFEGRRNNLVEQEARAVRYMNETAYMQNLRVIYRHVKAHTGIRDNRSLANHMCDKRAKQGMRRARAYIQQKEQDAHTQSP